MKISGAIIRRCKGQDNEASYTIKPFCDIKVRGRNIGNITISGNLPKRLPEGLIINVEVQEPGPHVHVDSYDISDGDRNRTVLSNGGINPDTFYKRVKFHKMQGCTWEESGLMDNPYQMDEFDKADILAKDFGYKMNDPKRLDSIIGRCIEDFRGNRQYQYMASEFIERIRHYEDMGAFGRFDSMDEIKMLGDERLIYTDALSDKQVLDAKKFIKKNIKERQTHYHDLLNADEIKKYLDGDAMLANSQRVAVRKLDNTRPTIVTGEAGTGKTNTVKAIIGAYGMYFGTNHICLMAPTGKAARRMTEATGMEATTIHSRLRKTPDSEFVFYNEDNPLPYKLYIVDESSMIDDLLMADLLRAIPNEAKLYLIGDCNQLYPVGVGEPFHEMISRKACDVVILEENFRQRGSDGILPNARSILAGENLQANASFEIREIDKKDIPKYISEEIQCISPYNELNAQINNLIMAKHQKDIKHKVFFEGEKVIATKNTKKFSNGDVGNISYIGDDQIHIELFGKDVLVDKEDWKLIMPAYSLTVHKCQGSEYDVINIFLPYEKTQFVSRRLVYTAVTRAKSKVNIFLYKEGSSTYNQPENCQVTT